MTTAVADHAGSPRTVAWQALVVVSAIAAGAWLAWPAPDGAPAPPANASEAVAVPSPPARVSSAAAAAWPMQPDIAGRRRPAPATVASDAGPGAAGDERAGTPRPLGADGTPWCGPAPLRWTDGQGGGTHDFCADGGSGLASLPGGRSRYSFDDRQGHGLVVTLAADGTVQDVAFDGARCVASACAGVVQARSAAGAVALVFAGTPLAAPEARRRATLSGEIALPAP